MSAWRPEAASPADAARRRSVDRWLLGATAAWALILLAAFALLWKYKSTPGRAAEAHERWPAESKVVRTPGLAEIVMVVHPKCSCSRASLDELAALMTRVGHLASATVLFVRPDGVPAGWENTDLLTSARRITGVTVQLDEGGVEAKRFGAFTSGATLVYSAAGDLLFSGGITLARGHAGDNAGRLRITGLLTDGKADRRDSPTFGCSIDGPTTTDELSGL